MIIRRGESLLSLFRSCLEFSMALSKELSKWLYLRSVLLSRITRTLSRTFYTRPNILHSAFETKNILDVLSEVKFSSTHWRELGGRLKAKDVDAIAYQHSNPTRCLEEVIREWQRDGDQPSWETLAMAVSLCRQGGGKNMAAKIRGLGEEVGVNVNILTILHVQLAIVLCTHPLYFIHTVPYNNLCSPA